MSTSVKSEIVARDNWRKANCRKWDCGAAFYYPEYKSWREFQKSLTQSTMLHDTIMLLKELWPLQNDTNKKKIGEMANRLREAQKALGEDVTQ